MSEAKMTDERLAELRCDVGTDQVYFTREAALTPKPAGSPAQQKDMKCNTTCS